MSFDEFESSDLGFRFSSGGESLTSSVLQYKVVVFIIVQLQLRPLIILSLHFYS